MKPKKNTINAKQMNIRKHNKGKTSVTECNANLTDAKHAFNESKANVKDSSK